MSLFSTPKCPSCIRRLAGGAFQQIRGNKKMTKVPTVTVRLLKDVPKYGPAGTLIPVARGRMRSIWYPQKVADYVHYTELKKIPRGEAPQRDFFFLADTVTGGKKKQKATVSLLSPMQTIAILEALLPPSLQFSSATISPTDHSLHGSVSTVDIANAIKMVSAANGEEGSRVVITPDQVELIGVDGDKIKMIGEYQFEIRMKGASDFVKRRATVQRQETY